LSHGSFPSNTKSKKSSLILILNVTIPLPLDDHSLDLSKTSTHEEFASTSYPPVIARSSEGLASSSSSVTSKLTVTVSP
jgi:hypothetical protein